MPLPPVVQIVIIFLLKPLQKVRDIHIEPYEDRARVRYRIDGLLMKL